MNARLRAFVIVLILAAVAWTVREIPRFGFLPLVDDDVNIFFNPHLGTPDAARIGWMFRDFSYVHRYMPLGWLGFSLVYVGSGLDPAGYHWAGVGLHAVNAVLVFLLLGQLLRRFAADRAERVRILAAGAAALLWALHPLRVETTAWCSGLLYAQAGCLALLCSVARLAELHARRAGETRRARAWFAAAWLAFAGSILTYPVALFLPFALCIVDQAWLGGSEAGDPAGAAARRAAWRGTAALAALAVAGLTATFAARGTVLPSWGRAPTLAEFGLFARALQAAYSAVVYVARTAWPADLSWMPLTLFEPTPPRLLAWLAVAVLLLISGGVWALRRRAPFLAPCWASYLVLITPNLGLTEHPHTLADRYLYFTGVVFSVALAFALARLRPARARAAAWTACSLAAAACAVVSVGRARIWRDADSFERHMMKNPDSDLAHITAARAGKLRFLEGDVRGGRAAVRRELERAPSVGGVLLTWREVAPAAPLGAAVAATELQEWPAAPWSCVETRIARELIAEGRLRDALAHLDAAVARSPYYLEARFRRGVLLASLGRPRAAMRDWLMVERGGARTPPASRRVADFMADCVAGSFRKEGDERAAAAVWREKAEGRLRPGAGGSAGRSP